MKNILFWLLMVCGIVPTTRGQQPDVTASRQQAIAEFPELARAESPLNQKFLAEYERLKSINDPLLSRPGWPLALARKCAAELNQPVVVPPSPEEVAAKAKAAKDKAEAVNLVGQVIQKVPGGLLVECVQPRAPRTSGLQSVGGGGGAFYGSGPDSDVFGIFFLKDHPKQKELADDDAVACKAVPDGQYSRHGETHHAYRCIQVIESK